MRFCKPRMCYFGTFHTYHTNISPMWHIRFTYLACELTFPSGGGGAGCGVSLKAPFSEHWDILLLCLWWLNQIFSWNHQESVQTCLGWQNQVKHDLYQTRNRVSFVPKPNSIMSTALTNIKLKMKGKMKRNVKFQYNPWFAETYSGNFLFWVELKLKFFTRIVQLS